VRERERQGGEHGRRLLRQLRTPTRQLPLLARLEQRWLQAAADHTSGLERRLGVLDAGLRLLGPQGVLDRGYSIVARTDGTIVQDAAQIEQGEALALSFARGGALAKVTAKRES
jgi:exodeoxyribonuclease VII large subunit